MKKKIKKISHAIICRSWTRNRWNETFLSRSCRKQLFVSMSAEPVHRAARPHTWAQRFKHEHVWVSCGVVLIHLCIKNTSVSSMLQFSAHVTVLSPADMCCSPLQRSREAGFRRSLITASSPWRTGTLFSVIPTCRDTSRCCCGPNPTRPPGSAPSACRTTTSWASRTSVSWRPGCSSAPWSGPATSPSSRTCRWRTRWRCSASPGANCSSWTPRSAPCPSTSPRCWPPPASTRPRCRRTGWWPSWTTSGSSRSRWRSWRCCTWTQRSTAASRPSCCSPQVNCRPVSRTWRQPAGRELLKVWTVVWWRKPTK